MYLDQFFRDLDRVSASVVPTNRLGEFLEDLKRVSADASAQRPREQAITVKALADLGTRFDHVRQVVLQKLGGSDWLAKVAEYDPLKCPIGLFTTLDLGRYETAHTGALTWLLNPSEAHGFVDILLRSLVRHLFKLEGDFQLFGVNTVNEFPISGERGRLDIHVRGEWKLAGAPEGIPFRIIIEAKIDAGEGEDQCEHYEDHAQLTEEECEQVCFVFLTHDGRQAESTKSHGKKWICVSFIELMAMFRPHLTSLRHKPGFEFLRHYMSGVLQELYHIECGRPELTSNLYLIGLYLGQTDSN